MMSRLLRNIFFILIFFGACGAGAQLQTQLVVTKEQRKKIQLGGFFIVLSPATVVQTFESEEKFDLKLVSGQIFFEGRGSVNNLKSHKKIYVDTIYFKSIAQTGVYLSKLNQQVEVLNFSSEAYILSLRDGREHIILGGFQNWVSGFGGNLVSALGMPRKIEVRSGIEVLSKVTFSSEEFNRLVVSFKEVWKSALNNEVIIYRSVASKMIEEEELVQQRKIEEAKNKRAQARRLRQQFFTQTFSK